MIYMNCNMYNRYRIEPLPHVTISEPKCLFNAPKPEKFPYKFVVRLWGV